MLIEQAVEWSRDEHPLAEPCVCETAEPIVTSTIFWSVVNDACQFPAKEATIIFDKDDFPVDEWADMVSGLGIEGLTCEVEDEAPLPCVKISVDWSPEDAGFVSDEMADASVESLKTWVQDVIVDSKVCPFTRSAEVAATGLENQGVEKGPIMYPVCGAVGSGGAALVRVLRAFWGSSIDMLSQPPSEASTVLLSVPAYAERDHDAFVDMTQVVVKTLKHVGAEHQLSLVFFHPDYERSVIEPVDSFTHGHLPPHKWLRAYVRLTEGDEVATGLSEAQLKHADYQRRAPARESHCRGASMASRRIDGAIAAVPYSTHGFICAQARAFYDDQYIEVGASGSCRSGGALGGHRARAGSEGEGLGRARLREEHLALRDGRVGAHRRRLQVPRDGGEGREGAGCWGFVRSYINLIRVAVERRPLSRRWRAGG